MMSSRKASLGTWKKRAARLNSSPSNDPNMVNVIMAAIILVNSRSGPTASVPATQRNP